MSKLIAVDPGIRGCGVALFQDDVLIAAAYVKNFYTAGNGPDHCWRMAHDVVSYCANLSEKIMFVQNENFILAVEWPQVYTSSKGDPNDLLALAGVDSALHAILKERLRGRILEVKHLLPRQWKGQMSKEVCHARIKERLSPDELITIEPTSKSLIHNVWDSVGIGLHALNRLAPRRATIL